MASMAFCFKSAARASTAGIGVHVIWDQVEARREKRQPVK